MAQVSYKALVNKLEKELSVTFTTPENPTKVKRKISMAKHREGIDGKLIFSHQTTTLGDETVHVITVVLTPKRNQLEIVGLNSAEGF